MQTLRYNASHARTNIMLKAKKQNTRAQATVVSLIELKTVAGIP